MSKITQRKQALVAQIQGLKLEQEENTPEFIKACKSKLPAIALVGGLIVGIAVISGKKSKKKRISKQFQNISPLWAILIPVGQWGLKKLITELSKQVDYRQLYQVISSKITAFTDSRKSTVSESANIQLLPTEKNKAKTTAKKKALVSTEKAEKAKLSNQVLPEKKV